MSWRTDLKKASYGDIELKVLDVGITFGRDAKIKGRPAPSLQWKEGREPQGLSKEQSYIQDNGILPRQFAVTAYFAGDDYTAERDKFIEAVEDGEPRLLTLPLFDPVKVSPVRGVVTYRNNEGGYETVKIQFIQYAETVQPTSTDNTKDELEEEVENAKSGLFSTMASKFKTVTGKVEDKVADMQKKLSESFLTTAYNGIKTKTDSLEKFSQYALELSNDSIALISEPVDLANKISDTFSNLTTAFNAPLGAFNASKQVLESYGESIGIFSGDTESELDAISNREIQINVVNNASLLEMSKAIASMEFDSIDHALTVKSTFEELLRQQQLANAGLEGFEQTYYDMSKMLSLVADHINNQANLASSTTIEYNELNPALLIATDLYGDADRADEIQSMNGIRNPLFCDTSLNVLSV